ncbi:nuclear transport factor 2 family protein [Candidatus Methylobacter oryzae]|uniref:Nuclear transport factor 2 family protein n=1 Tax=Candidatus Methylobacter oryzae TaxID=2497749 RepID=A0ABY3C8Z6_9GAMM|nr:nuclear transport factor 2 family protein [Candidatus Methylobacter oryzae]TRW93174.1 nuclear transport factor 2 family protein [Candidatus Methylobacter oryzae]
MIIRFDDPVQQEIWTTIRALNDAWTKGNPDDLANYFHRNMVAITSTDRMRREGGVDCIAGWKGFAEATRIHHWRETDPVIHVYGDASVVAYYFDIAFDMNGQTFNSAGRDMFFMVKEEGRWWAVGDQFSSFPV